jgi:hypothetical protein
MNKQRLLIRNKFESAIASTTAMSAAFAIKGAYVKFSYYDSLTTSQLILAIRTISNKYMPIEQTSRIRLGKFIAYYAESASQLDNSGWSTTYGIRIDHASRDNTFKAYTQVLPYLLALDYLSNPRRIMQCILNIISKT